MISECLALSLALFPTYIIESVIAYNKTYTVLSKDIVVEIFYADSHREYFEWMEIYKQFISLPGVMFTRVKKSKS